jgi:hypothetical protein
MQQTSKYCGVFCPVGNAEAISVLKQLCLCSTGYGKAFWRFLHGRKFGEHSLSHCTDYATPDTSNTAQGLRLSFYRRYKHQVTRHATAASDSVPSKGRDSFLLKHVLGCFGAPCSRFSNRVTAAISMSIRHFGTEAAPSPAYEKVPISPYPNLLPDVVRRYP